ncbi:MAG: DUF559 domain-containing protein, partial [Erysipelotrichaceae bacterium]|nr:DUF559 domain-containing protein [Erysipelotrichaceae bacterium]
MMFDSISRKLPILAEISKNNLKIREAEGKISSFYQLLLEQPAASEVCGKMKQAVLGRSASDYRSGYQKLVRIFEKESQLYERKQLLEKLYSFAPDWSSAIQMRQGIHGSDQVPLQIEEAWMWKQYQGILDELTKESVTQLQADSIALSREYRAQTAELSKWKAWYALKTRIENDCSLQSSLVSWKQNTKKMGKARRMTAVYKAAAREHMIKCQKAVPVWIMPMAKVFENYTPGQTEFDVLIVDEASQSDLSALAMTYFAKKVIIVGDDRQVSPSAVGVDQSRVMDLASGTIREQIPSWELYTGTTSLYDIVSTVYPSLMLREHFRCVPDIIGYSNKLSYDYKIKPLRDTSKCLLTPAVVNYRVSGHRSQTRKQNDAEARSIVALIKACIKQKEYDSKTFGIISLLGDEQTKLIEKYLFEQIDPEEIDKRNIIYGTSAQFQGDERDVIFLSLVDSREKEGPLHKIGYGSDDMYRKRYNVAASRARDQLWVVHSLDSYTDLKPGDLRRDLIEYAANPKAFSQKADQVEKAAESPFEAEVGKAIAARNYHLIQQWPVGAYRIDMVVQDGDRKAAIECDGEKWHSSEAQIKNDMERQTILERLGWRFIRIRGSEYYRNPEKTMDRVFQELENLNIHPVSQILQTETVGSDLLERVKRQAQEYLAEQGFDFDAGSREEAVKFALNSLEEGTVTEQIS